MLIWVATPMYTLLERHGCQLNPFFRLTEARVRLPGITGGGGVTTIASATVMDGAGETVPAWGRPEASWQQMFLCQPAVRNVIMDVEAEMRPNRFVCESLLLRRAGGVRAKDVLNAAKTYCAQYDGSNGEYFWMKFWLFGDDIDGAYDAYVKKIAGTNREINLKTA